jgi:hypothetical protein
MMAGAEFCKAVPTIAAPPRVGLMAGADVLSSGTAGEAPGISGRAFADTAGIVSAAGTICAFIVRRSIAPTTKDFILASPQWNQRKDSEMSVVSKRVTEGRLG